MAKSVSESCRQYSLSLNHNKCEISHLVIVDEESRDWLNKDIAANSWNAYRPCRHHIWGRGKKPELNWFCSLIQLWDSTHRWLHDRSPSKGELA